MHTRINIYMHDLCIGSYGFAYLGVTLS